MTQVRRRILVVEDDPETAAQIVDSFTTNGYQVDIAANGNDALSRGRSVDYAVMTIDRMLPDIDGLAVMQNLKKDGIVAPVLIISALGEIDDRMRGLRAGGDDYLVKPFAFDVDMEGEVGAVFHDGSPILVTHGEAARTETVTPTPIPAPCLRGQVLVSRF